MALNMFILCLFGVREHASRTVSVFLILIWFSLHGVASGIPFGSVNLAFGVSDDESQARRASPRATLLSLGCAS
jgi:hypothetical protein